MDFAFRQKEGFLKSCNSSLDFLAHHLEEGPIKPGTPICLLCVASLCLLATYCTCLLLFGILDAIVSGCLFTTGNAGVWVSNPQ